MKQGIYVVHDIKAAAFLTPFFALTDGVAMRYFENAIADPEHQFAINFADYSLYRIGEYLDGSGTIVPADVPIQLLTGFQVHNKISSHQGDSPSREDTDTEE